MLGLMTVVYRFIPLSIDTTTIDRPISHTIVLLSITEHALLMMVTNFVECSSDGVKDTVGIVSLRINERSAR